MKRIVFMVLASLLLGGFASSAQSNAATSAIPTPVPRAEQNFAPMKMFLGTWTCTQTVRGSARSDTSTTTMGLDGEYMVTHDVAPPFDKYRTRSITTDSYLTYNPINHMWMTLSVDNFGGYTVSSSPGWRGNTLTTTVKMASDGSTGSDVLTKVSDTQTTDASVSTNSKGHVTRQTSTCTKSA